MDRRTRTRGGGGGPGGRVGEGNKKTARMKRGIRSTEENLTRVPGHKGINTPKKLRKQGVKGRYKSGRRNEKPDLSDDHLSPKGTFVQRGNIFNTKGAWRK